MKVMIALGLASIMICLGMILRAKVGFLRNMLVPTTVIAGALGFAFLNLVEGRFEVGVDANLYTDIVNQLFTLSFISIGLTRTPKSSGQSSESATAKSVAKGSLAMGIVWCILYGLTAAVGVGVISMVGQSVGMDPMYGMLIPYGFCQGPGQAATFGAIYEEFGYENAAVVGVTFSVIGFLMAFLIGVPLAKRGLKLGIAKHSGKLNESVARGYFSKEEQRESMGKVTTYSGSLETLSFHFALMGLCYVLAIGIAKVFALIPGFLGTSMSGMLFMNGMIAAYIVNFIMKKLKIDHLHNDALQTKITGFTSDYLVVCAFMAVQLSVVGKWLVPIIIECLIITVISVVICIYFAQRIGGENDFERTLGLFGSATGTVPSGIALIRMVDPKLKTTTATELGMMNFPMMFCTVCSMVMMAGASHTISLSIVIAILLAMTPVYLIILKVTKCWNKKSYSLSRKWNNAHREDLGGQRHALQGRLNLSE